MRKYLFASMLAIAIGGHFIASADEAKAARHKAPNTTPKAAIAKPAAGKLPARKLIQKPTATKPPRIAPKKQKAGVHHFHHKHLSSSSSSHKESCCEHIKHVECKINEILDIVSCGDPIHITQEMVSGGFTITESGAYKLCSDIVFTPAANGENAITVDAGVTNVNIDFANFTLSMNPSSLAADNNGILIKSDCENIVIHGGTITGFSASSIRGHTGLNTIVVDSMILEGIPNGNRLINETVASGVNLGAIVQNTASSTPAVTPPSYNISLNNLIIRGILLDNLTIAEQAAWGVSLWYCNDILLDHVDVSQLTMNGLVQNSLTNCQGFAFQFCTNTICRFCSSKDLVSLSPNFNGLVVGDATGSVYLKCARCENYDCSYANNLGTRRSGGLVFVGTNDFVAERCTADSNILVDQTAAGIQSHWGFESVGIVAIGIPRPQRGVMKDCHVLNMPTAFVAIASDDVIFENCTATGGSLSGVAGINTVGFQCSGTSNGITFKNCIATGFNSPTSATGNGFRASSGSNISILDCVATKNAQGISVASGVTRLVADSNEVAFNTTGVLDTTAAQTPNLYTRNVAFANTTNYSVNTANPNFVVVQASQAAGYPLYTAANASPLSNFSLQP